jgi:hypothetical protein
MLVAQLKVNANRSLTLTVVANEQGGFETPVLGMLAT